MAEFRKVFYALGFAAMLAGVSSTASAQQIICNGGGTVPTAVRAESFADLVGDYLLDCTGGTPTLPGQSVPAVNITVTLSQNITSKVLTSGSTIGAGGQFTEALLIIDEPNATPNLTRRLLACGDVGAPYQVNGLGSCGIVATNDPNTTYSGTPLGNGISDTDCVIPAGGVAAYGCGRPNVFQGRQGLAQNSGNTNIMVFNGVPFDAPGSVGGGRSTVDGHRRFRITNIRANSPTVAGGFLTADIQMTVNITGVSNISIGQPTQRVANVFIGIQTPTLSAFTTFVQCSPETRNNPTPTLRFREGFGSSFRAKGLEQVIANGLVSNVQRYQGTNSSYGTGTINQNVPGVNYNTESGFVSSGTTNNPAQNPPLGLGNGSNSTGNGALANSTGIAAAGIATQGTRIAATFSNLPVGLGVTVPNVVNLVQVGTTNITGVAVRTAVVSARGDGPFTPYSGTTSVVAGDMVVYEVLFADASVSEDLLIPITMTNPTPAISDTEINKTGQVAGGFAPFILQTDDSNVWGRAQQPSDTVQTVLGATFLPVPRFRTQSAPVDLVRVNKCSCNLLFPFVSNASTSNGNFDTGIALANTSLSPGSGATAATRFGFGANTAQSGPVQFWYYPANATDPPVATQCTNTVATGVCPSPTQGPSAVQAGETLLYVLSSGSSRWGLKGAPGFTGYMIAQASFQYCHAFAYISPQGAFPLTNGMSVGYLALQLDNTSLPSRTGLPAEQLSH